VKLYAMAQIRAIGLQTDTITPNDFKIVASEKLGLVKPALDALLSGDKKRIAAIGDIAPISIDDYYAAYSAMLPPTAENIPQKSDKISLSEQLVLKLLGLDVEPVQAKRLAGKVMTGNPNNQSLAALAHKAFALYLSECDNAAQDSENTFPDDVRGASDYEGMKSAGLVGKPL